MIIIDKREPKQIADYLHLKHVPYSYATLVIGDYRIHNISVERKTWTDFFQSYQSGRLYKQMLQLYQQQQSVLVLEGFKLEYIHNSEAFYTLLSKILFSYQIKIVFTLTVEDTAAFLIALYHTIQYYVPPALPRLLPYNVPLVLRKKYILSCFPHIGDKKAQNILARCPSLRQLFVAPPDELHRYGIGKQGQKAFQDILDTEFGI